MATDTSAARNETPTERLDRNWADILQELRSVLTGTQLISGFLLAAAFQPRFADLDEYELVLYLTLVGLAGLATVLGLAPVILHRMLYGRRQKDRLVRTGNRILFVLLGVVSLLAVGVAGLIFDVAVSREAGFIAIAVALIAVAAVWIVVPVLARSGD
ncbi:DUF6328 family protein [Agromyces sp. H3Y2-19a]|jgi:hypothetical protein|uniref:DUF6328 family protein n=1 Tax=Agromyces TaxID=33877 RepID=UPI001E477D10|nr:MULTISPECIES: DUF6328 family protein [Agromyces]MCD5345673.1 DUF6328 family protein [Agromyces sp. S2-1-8]MDF0512040.1 DUF6328 family protein [Agromyces chromiiresistens]